MDICNIMLQSTEMRFYYDGFTDAYAMICMALGSCENLHTLTLSNGIEMDASGLEDVDFEAAQIAGVLGLLSFAPLQLAHLQLLLYSITWDHLQINWSRVHGVLRGLPQLKTVLFGQEYRVMQEAEKEYVLNEMRDFEHCTVCVFEQPSCDKLGCRTRIVG